MLDGLKSLMHWLLGTCILILMAVVVTLKSKIKTKSHTNNF